MLHTLRILIFILLAYSLALLASPAFAQSPTPSSTSKESEPTFEVSTTVLPTSNIPLPASISPVSPIYTDLLVSNMFHTFSCLMVGSSMIGQPCLTYQITKNAQGAIQSVPVLSQVNLQGGALGGVTSVIAMLYLNQPVRTSEYLASVGQGLGIVKEAHAQVGGSGAGVLSPIIKLWQVSRNLAYVIMIIIFVIIGLMIMFRNKINPQTVITAQAALPGLVIGLILITFSYFLAALVTDISFLGINVVGAYFSAAQPNSAPILVQNISTQNVGTIFSKYVGMIAPGDISGALQPVLDSLDGGVQFFVRLLAGLIAFQTGSSVGGPIGSMGGLGVCLGVGIAGAAPTAGFSTILAGLSPFCTLVGSLVGGIAMGTAMGGLAMNDPAGSFSWVLYFIAIAIMIYTMFKLLLRLINNYLSIIFLTISAPFHFLAASLPGRQGLATNWILNMLCNVLAFPAVFAVFYFVAYLWGANTDPGRWFGITANQALSGTETLPLFGGLNLNFVRILLAFGALLATPAIPDIICRTIGRMSQAGQLIGQEISGSTKSGQGYYGQATGGVRGMSRKFTETSDTWYGKPPGLSTAAGLEKRGIDLPGILRKRVYPQ